MFPLTRATRGRLYGLAIASTTSHALYRDRRRRSALPAALALLAMLAAAGLMLSGCVL